MTILMTIGSKIRQLLAYFEKAADKTSLILANHLEDISCIYFIRTPCFFDMRQGIYKTHLHFAFDKMVPSVVNIFNRCVDILLPAPPPPPPAS